MKILLYYLKREQIDAQHYIDSLKAKGHEVWPRNGQLWDGKPEKGAEFVMATAACAELLDAYVALGLQCTIVDFAKEAGDVDGASAGEEAPADNDTKPGEDDKTEVPANDPPPAVAGGGETPQTPENPPDFLKLPWFSLKKETLERTGTDPQNKAEAIELLKAAGYAIEAA